MALKECKECGQQISTKATKCPKCGAPQKKKTSRLAWLVLIFIVVWIYSTYSSNTGTTTTTHSRKPTAINNTSLVFTWNKAAYGSVMKADFTITNNNQYQIKDIEITCEHVGKSGTQIDSNKRTIYDSVPAKGKNTFKAFNMGFIHSQADMTRCTITDLKW